MRSPFFSILMPTRNRPALAQKALNSVLSQAYGDFEVIYADNSDTETLPDGMDERVTYVPPGRAPIPMWENWQDCLDIARGQYVVILIDKCQLVPGALRTLSYYARARDVVTWGIERPDDDAEVWRIHSRLANYRKYSQKAAIEQLTRHWDLSYVFPRGCNMMFRRDQWIGKGPLFTAINPDYVAGMRLVNQLEEGCGVLHLDAKIMAIPRNVPATMSTGAAVALGLPEANEYLDSLNPVDRLGDFPAAYLMSDFRKVFGFQPGNLPAYQARYLRHLLDRTRAGATVPVARWKDTLGFPRKAWALFILDCLKDAAKLPRR